MKKYLIIVIIMFNLSVLFGQDQSVVTITPEKPLRGKSVTITYDPSAKMAKLKDPKNMVLVYDNFAEYYGKAKKMTQNDGKWSVTLPLSDTITAFIAFYFRDGVDYDDNKEKKFYFLVYKSEERPVKNAYYYKTKYLQDIYGFGQIPYSTRDSMVKEDLKRELQYWPDNKRVKSVMSPVITSKISKIMYDPDSISRKMNSDLDSLKKKSGKDSIFKKEIKRMEESKFRFDSAKKERDLQQEILKEPDEENKKNLIEQYISNYSNNFSIGYMYRDLFNYYARKKDTAKILEIGEKWIASEKRAFSTAYNDVAWNLAINRFRLDKALEYSNKAIEIMDSDIGMSGVKNTDYGPVVVAMPQNEKNNMIGRKFKLSNYLDTKGWIYYQMGLFNEAEPILRESFYAQQNNSEILSHIIEVYKKTGKPDSIYAISGKALQNNFGDKKIEEDFRKSYIQKFGSEKGYTDTLGRIKEISGEFQKKQATFRKINKDGPKFIIEDDKGGVFNIESEKGKVVFLCFFETVGISFRTRSLDVEKIYEKYKNRSDFTMLAVNTGKGKLETRENHNRIIKEYGINFPTAYDKNGKVSKLFYKFSRTSILEGFPSFMIDTASVIEEGTAFVFDKSGKIQYTNIYQYGNWELKDISFQIDDLLEKKDQ